MTPPAKLLPIVEQILAARGLASGPEREAFLVPDYEKDLHDPLLMTDMAAAVARIGLAVERSERVVVYGDYDIDGITASAVLMEGLTALGLTATSYIPDRFEEGYGINQAALEQLQAAGAELVISVDCGITSRAEAAWAMEHGLELIITDHHAVPAELPEAIAVLNPRRPGDRYPFKELAGVGVAFKLVQALAKAYGQPSAGQEKWLLDLVALGTVCDVVPLVGENRALVHFGLRVLRQTRRPGLRALAEVGGIAVPELDSYHLGYVLGPRMNAAGRLEHAADSLRLVQTTDETEAGVLAARLDGLNLQRRSDQLRIVQEASERATDYPDDLVLVLSDPSWSHGIVGIAAAKLSEQAMRPVIVLQEMGETTKGSARSAGDFHLAKALQAVSHILQRHGGHQYAAGMTMDTARVAEFRQAINSYAREQGLTLADFLRAAPRAEAWVQGLEELNHELLEQLGALGPFGRDNPCPLLGAHALTVTDIRPVGAEGKHLKLGFQDATNRRIGGIGFGLAPRHAALKPGDSIDVVFELAQNDFNGQTSLQLQVQQLL